MKKKNRIFIIPTGHGIAFLAMVVVIVMIAAASANNLVFTLGFILFALYLVSMVMTHLNLSDLEFEIEETDLIAGQSSSIVVRCLNKGNSALSALELAWSQRGRVFVRETFKVSTLVRIEPKNYENIGVEINFQHRGYFELPDLIISTKFPFGLFKAWMRISSKKNIYVYPQPLKGLIPELFSGENFNDGKVHLGVEKKEDFKEHASYQSGESQHHVDWRAFARRGELLLKRYEGDNSSWILISWRQVKDLPFEEGLSMLADALMSARAQGIGCRFDLHPEEILVGSNDIHYRDCLRRLTLLRGAE